MRKIDAKTRKAITNVLFDLSKVRHDAIPITMASDELAKHNLKFEEFILCGREGRCNLCLFDTVTGEEASSDLILYWNKGEVTGTYEINMYLS